MTTESTFLVFCKKYIPYRIRRIIYNHVYAPIIMTELYDAIVTKTYAKIRYWGNRFECPFCGGHFKELIPGGMDYPVLKERKVVGGGYRQNVFCPVCKSFDRERLLYLFLKNKTNIFQENIKILHVAPEKSLQKALIRHSNIDYISADLESSLAMVKMDITKINFGDETFDVIICNHVLEHIPDDHIAMQEIFRVLKPHGWAILQVPISLTLEKTYENPKYTSPQERINEFGQIDHVRIYALDYKNRLESVGFSVKAYDYQKEIGERLTQKFGLIKDEKVYICKKMMVLSAGSLFGGLSAVTEDVD